MKVALVAVVLLVSATQAEGSGILLNSYSAAVSFSEANISGTTIGIAFDGTNYWSAAGGSAIVVNFAQHNSAGAVLNTFMPLLDFRSVFTDADGDLFARTCCQGQNTIYEMTSPGVFSPYLTLLGPTVGFQSALVLNGAGTEYISLSDTLAGRVDRWNLAGGYLGFTTLAGFGTNPGETSYPQNRGIASIGTYYFTYNNGLLSAWDLAGVRVGQATLLGAGSGFDSNFSLSYANGLIFIGDGQTWRGYDLGLDSTPVPEPVSLILVGAGLTGLALRRRRQTDV